MVEKDTVKKMSAKTGKSGSGVKSEGKAATAAPKKTTAPKKAVHPKSKKKKISLSLEAPHATQVCIVGSFNEWDTTADSLQRNGQGVWECTLALEAGEYQYRFIVDGIWWDDPANPMKCYNEFGTKNCIIIV